MIFKSSPQRKFFLRLLLFALFKLATVASYALQTGFSAGGGVIGFVIQADRFVPSMGGGLDRVEA